MIKFRQNIDELLRKEMDGIKIVGKKNFILNTIRALQLIKSGDIESFLFIKKYVGVIKQNDFSGIDVFSEQPTFLVGNATSDSNSYWYASCILHDAEHSFLYFSLKEQGEDGLSGYQGYDAEMYCLEKQIELLKKINAPSYLIEYATTLKNSNWYDIPVSRRKW